MAGLPGTSTTAGSGRSTTGSPRSGPTARCGYGDARSPWVLDVPFTPDAGGRWTNKRDRAHTEDLDDVTWVAPDGLRYARPEVTLMFKAAQAREKDRADADVVLPMLDPRAREWLSDTVARMDPDHPWVLPGRT